MSFFWKYAITICWVIALFPVNISSQVNALSANEEDRLLTTFTFYIAQQASLESVSERFPDLQDKAIDASKEWAEEFRPSIKKIDSCLSVIKGIEWENEKIKIYEKYRRADHSNVTEKEALQFIEIIFQRSYGKIQSPVIETLLTFMPEYKAAPEKEFSDGFVNSYFSATPKKKAPVNIRIIYPKSWKAIDGILQNNIQQIFISNYGTGNLALSFLMERTNNLPVDKNSSLFSENNLKKFCLKSDSIININTSLDIDFCSAASITYLRREVEIDKKFTILFEAYHSYYKNQHFALIFSYKTDIDNYNLIKPEFEKYRKLIRKILFNVVILSQWEQKRF